MKQRQKRAGFTLVELLVVIAIIAMLASMLLPAVQGARAAARKTQCINNHHNIGIALIRYEGEKNRYPGYVNNQGAPGAQATGWVFPLLPYLDRSDIFNSYQNTSGASGTPNQHLKILVCPDDAESINVGTNATYVVNAGISGDSGGNLESASGVFTNQFKSAATDVVKLTNTGSITDGLATTLMVGENVDASTWIATQEGCVGFNWTTGGAAADKMNYQTGTVTCGDAAARPSSYHAGGVVFTFCDGHTQFISEDIAYDVYQMLCTPRGRALTPQQGILNESSY